MDREQNEVAEILDENPGLQPSREEIFAKAYTLARKDAARETNLPLHVFPEEPPFSLAECESADFQPTARGDEAAAERNGDQLARGDKRD